MNSGRAPHSPSSASARAVRRALAVLDCPPRTLRLYADVASAFSTRVPATVEYLVEPSTCEELARVWQALAEEGVAARILGGGTNTIPVEPFLRGVTVSTRQLRGYQIAGNRVRVLAGTPLQTLGSAAVRAGLQGLETLAGVPGSVGGALVMNAGGAHGTIGDIVDRVEVLEPTGEVQVLSRDECAFGYRTSSLTGGRLVMSASLVLPAGSPTALAARRREVLQRKRSVQPLGAWSAGCYFRNPGSGLSAGRLLDEAGLKGSRIGGAVSSPVHANFLCNQGGGTGADLAALASRIRRRILQLHGLELQEEVKLWR